MTLTAVIFVIASLLPTAHGFDFPQDLNDIHGKKQSNNYQPPVVHFKLVYNDRQELDPYQRFEAPSGGFIDCTVQWSITEHQRRPAKTKNQPLPEDLNQLSTGSQSIAPQWWMNGRNVTVTGRLQLENLPVGIYRCLSAPPPNDLLPNGLAHSSPVVVTSGESIKKASRYDSHQIFPQHSTVVSSDVQGAAIRLHCLGSYKKSENFDDREVRGEIVWLRKGVELQSYARTKIGPSIVYPNRTHVILSQDVLFTDVQLNEADIIECVLKSSHDSSREDKITFGLAVESKEGESVELPFDSLALTVEQENSAIDVQWRMTENGWTASSSHDNIFLLTYHLTQAGSPLSISSTTVLDDYECLGANCSARCSQSSSSLRPAANYTFQFSAMTSDGTRSALSSPITLITWDTVANKTLDLMMKPLSSGGIEVKWKRPTLQGTITGYVMEYKSARERTYRTVFVEGEGNSGGDEVSHRIDNLTRGQTFLVRVYPETLAGRPSYTELANENYDSFFPATPIDTEPYEDVGSFAFDVQKVSDQLQISWNLRSSFSLSFEVGAVQRKIKWEIVDADSSDGSLSIRIDRETAFNVVCARIGNALAGCRSLFVGIPFRKIVDEPVGFDLFADPEEMTGEREDKWPLYLSRDSSEQYQCARHGDGLRFSWTPDEPSDSYLLRIGANGTVTEVKSNTTQVDVPNLPEGSVYDVTISANSAGRLQEISSLRCYMPYRGFYMAPLNVSAKGVDETSVRLSWNRERFKIHRQPLAWIIRVTDMNASRDWEEILKVPVAKLYLHIVKNLSLDHVYSLSVAAVGKDGIGSWTTIKNVRCVVPPLFPYGHQITVLAVMIGAIILVAGCSAVVCIKAKLDRRHKRSIHVLEKNGSMDTIQLVVQCNDRDTSLQEPVEAARLRNFSKTADRLTSHNETEEELLIYSEASVSEVFDEPQSSLSPVSTNTFTTVVSCENGGPKRERAKSDQTVENDSPSTSTIHGNSSASHEEIHGNASPTLISPCTVLPQLHDSGIVFDENHHVIT